MNLFDNIKTSLFSSPGEALAEALWALPPPDLSDKRQSSLGVSRGTPRFNLMDRGKFREEMAISVKKALDRGANPSTAINMVKFGKDETCSPLGRAVHLDHAEIVEMLLDSGAEINAVGLNHGGAQSAVESTALGVAILFDKTALVKVLCARGASMSAVDKKGSSALCFAARYSEGEPAKLNTIKALIKAGANLNAVDSAGNTALHIAARAGNYELVKVLVDAGAKLDVRDKLNRTPLMALTAGLFLNYPEPLESADSKTPADEVPKWERAGELCIKALLAGGADAQAVGEKGKCALRLMEHAPAASWIKALVEAGAHPESLAADGLSPLDAALSHKGAKWPRFNEHGKREAEKAFEAGCAEMSRQAKSMRGSAAAVELTVAAEAQTEGVATLKALTNAGALEAIGAGRKKRQLALVQEDARAPAEDVLARVGESLVGRRFQRESGTGVEVAEVQPPAVKKLRG